MSSILLSLPDLWTNYKTWVSQNPKLASDFETTVRWISYFLAGKINNSHVFSELTYCLSNLLVLFNDQIINSIRQIEAPSSANTLKLWLTVLEYSEVLFELTARRLWGNFGRWIVIVSIQIFKCISRVILLQRHKESIIQTPPIAPLNRIALSQATNNLANNFASVADVAQTQIGSDSFKLKSTGRVVRKVSASPPINLRSWKPLQNTPDLYDPEQAIKQALAGRQLIAEYIYVFKPLTHLAALTCFGEKSWKPWIVSLAMDVSSLQLYGSSKNQKFNTLTPKQRIELSKRSLLLALYLLRSPFYEKHSKDRINAILMSLSKNVPLIRIIAGPLAQYLPFWQSVYFYMWST